MIGTLVFSAPIRAGTAEETNLFGAASRQFVDMLYPQAELSFSNFFVTYSNSPLRAEAALYLARARLGQSNYAGAIHLLQTHLPSSGGLGADYVFWIAEAHYQRGETDDYEAAINGCSNLLYNFPTSGLRLQAAYYQALAYAKKGEIPQSIQVLSAPDGAFSLAARADTNSEFAISGLLLLSEDYLVRRQYAEGEKVVRGINPRPLTADFKWRRQYLLCRLELAGGQANMALDDSTNLVELTFGDRRQIDTTFLRAEIFEQLNQTSAALQTYTNNLEKRFPADVQRRALVKTIELTLRQNQPREAQAQLQDFIATRPGDPAVDAACMLLGDLYLKTYAAGAASPSGSQQTNTLSQGGTNLLQAAATNLDRVIQEFPKSQFVGNARLDRGWCDWCQGKIAEAKTNFMEAASRLPPSEEQATARFKLADAQFELHDYAEAAANYNLLLEQYAAVPSITNGLFDEALYQTVQACVRMGDTNGALQAANKLLAWFPRSYFGERGLLLIGEDQNRKYNYAAARATFNELLEKFPKTPQLAALHFAIARTYDYEGDASAAVAAYDQWITHFPQDALLPQVEFSRALALSKAGRETNALMSLTNFIVQFPSNSLAPLAQNWIADYYWNNHDLINADKAYQQIYQKYPDAGKLAFEARMMVGRADFALQDYQQARKDFSALVNDPATPPAMQTEGLFALGDTILEQFYGNSASNSLLNEAIAVFAQITNATPGNTLAALALGRLGDCYRQWADVKSDPNSYTNAAQMYQAALNLCRPPASQAGPAPAPTRADVLPAGVPARPVSSGAAVAVDTASCDQAEVGLGLVAERQRQPDRALEYYSKVLYAGDADPYWVEQAGVAAARLCEERQQWEQAVHIYNRVLQAVPSLRPTLVNKIAAAQSHADTGKN